MSPKSTGRPRPSGSKKKASRHRHAPTRGPKRDEGQSPSAQSLLAEAAAAVPAGWLAATAPDAQTSTDRLTAARVGTSSRSAAQRTAADEVSSESATPDVPAPAAANGRSVPTDPSPSAPFLASDMPRQPLQVMRWTCGPLQGAEPQGLPLTYWFDAAPTGESYPVSVRFAGQRLAEDGTPVQGDSFDVVHTVGQVLPGSGRVALSAHVPGLRSGLWRVTAEPARSPLASPDGNRDASTRMLPQATTTGSTVFLPVAKARAPGARLGAWPSLVSAGVAVALASQFALAAHRHLPAAQLLAVSLLACLLGLAGAKAYYLVTHPDARGGPLQAGMSVQGFILAAVGTLLLGAWLTGAPVGMTLDVTAPGLLFGLMIGRLGCFFGGCCAGRPTASRWGVWSSDRRIGVRRIPVQLMESTVAGVVAAGTLSAVLMIQPPVDGLLFLAGLAAYISGRQMLFPLRDIRRKTAWGRPLTLVVATAVLAGTTGLIVAAG